ncbi:MAG: hypothetical protein R3267_04160 [Paenisporosarcina sp.]|nr:hypothetical protein [Paenisporosarcina sp.]
MTKKQLLDKIKDVPDNATILFFDGNFGFVIPENVQVGSFTRSPGKEKYVSNLDKWYEGCRLKKEGPAIFID